MFKQFKKLFISESDLDEPSSLLRIINLIQSNIESTLNTITDKTQNDSQILNNIQLKSGQVNVINHLLNRKLAGWVVIGKHSDSRIWDSQSTNKNAGLTLLLNCSADVTIDLMVF